MVKCYRIKIVGHVRGNGFRSAALDAAYRFRVHGFVQFDGVNSLIMEAESHQDNVDKFVHCCRDWFPVGTISDFILFEKDPENYSDFTIRRNISDEERLSSRSKWVQKLKNILCPSNLSENPKQFLI